MLSEDFSPVICMPDVRYTFNFKYVRLFDIKREIQIRDEKQKKTTAHSFITVNSLFNHPEPYSSIRCSFCCWYEGRIYSYLDTIYQTRQHCPGI